jgi:hypothetical protein
MGEQPIPGSAPDTAPAIQVPTPPQSLTPVSQPALAVLSDDRNRIRLTPEGRRLLMSTLLNASWTKDQPGRDQLLANLPQNLADGVSRSSNRNFDLNAIEKMAEDWGKMVGGMYEGKYALIVLVETAAALSGYGEDGAAPEAAVFLQFANNLRALVGLPPTSQPLSD